MHGCYTTVVTGLRKNIDRIYYEIDMKITSD
uniref:Uncharacterized protein n=1 Tax=Arundo donax TaxID=35708 RepID=A0A0A9AHH3_ARUDO